MLSDADALLPIGQQNSLTFVIACTERILSKIKAKGVSTGRVGVSICH